jgi:Protein of unknown function (DUF3237)
MAEAPALEFVFDAQVHVAPPIVLSVVAAGTRRIIPILGGEVTGPRLRAMVLPGGADWQIIEADVLARVVARYTLQAEDGALISVVNSGIRQGPPDVMRRLAAGEPVDPALYYFRAAPTFEVAPGRISG